MKINFKDKGVYLPAIFFLITLVTTTAAGAVQAGGEPLENIGDMILGLPFSCTMIPILLAHEMGHFFAAKMHGIQTSLPYFIPGFSIIGTFGAFIRLKSQITNKKVLIDIGASGPLMGFVASIIAIAIGLPLSEYVTETMPVLPVNQSSPLIFNLFKKLILPDPGINGALLSLHPVAFAGWIGLFLTSINLLPIGQLDGGHIMYALNPKKHINISLLLPVIMIALGNLWPGWFLWAFLTAFMGPKHPKIEDPDTPIDSKRLFIARLSFVVLILTFIPVPFY